MLIGAQSAFHHRSGQMLGVRRARAADRCAGGHADGSQGSRRRVARDEHGHAMAWPDMDAAAMTEFTPKPLPYPNLLEGFDPKVEKVLEADGHVAFVAPVHTLGWALVVVADDAITWR